MEMMDNVTNKVKKTVSSVKKFFKRLLIGVLVLMLAYVVIFFVSYKTIEVTIKDKERITIGTPQNIKSKYLVYATDEVFENSDAILFGKFNSSDVQNKLTAGNTYKIKVVGWRMPMFSKYRNIISVLEEKEKKQE